ncbi:MAG: isoprenyl transferase [Betaproteobacteria bacterium]|jgi:undecaprenyl diphosphate synthase
MRSRIKSSTLTIPATTIIPRHVAIIMDGNGRWANQRFLPRVAGHSKGLDTVREIVEQCSVHGIEYLTLFAFSSENWRRPKEEVSFLMNLFFKALDKEVARLHVNNIRLRLIGDMTEFPKNIQKRVTEAERLTEKNTGLVLTIAANYGGRWDILNATRQALIENPNTNPADINEAWLHPYLAMSYAPEPDLFIRTGGEQRVSNFLLWQLAYTEMYFTETFWPDFDTKAFSASLEWYRKRERRFGQTGLQVLENVIIKNA